MVTEKNHKSVKKPLLPIIIASGSVGIIVGVVGFWVYKQYSGQISNIVLFLLLALFVFALLTIVLFWMLKNYLTRLTFGSNSADAPDLIAEGQKFSKAIINNLIDNLPHNVYQGDKGLAKNLAHTLSDLLVWGRIRNWWWNWLMSIVVTIGGLAGTLVLVNQNELLQNQNQLIKNQMSLEEASRRGALVMLMSNIFDKVDDEIAEQRAEKRRKGQVVTDSTKFSLSQSLIGQIAALSQAFKPYRFMDGDTMIEEPLSPERGQLLVTITRLPLDTGALRRIYQQSTFEQADLSGANLKGAIMSGIDLRGANLKEANLREANLNAADLSGANLSCANLVKADLRMSILYLQALSFEGSPGQALYIVPSNASILDIIKMTILDGADLTGADLRDTKLLEFNNNRLENVFSLYKSKLPYTIDTSKFKSLHPELFTPPSIDGLYIRQQYCR